MTNTNTLERTIVRNNKFRLNKQKSIKLQYDMAVRVVEEEALKLKELNGLSYSFNEISRDTKLVFVKESWENKKKLTHAMLGPLKDRIKLVNKHFGIGMIRSNHHADDIKQELSVEDVIDVNSLSSKEFEELLLTGAINKNDKEQPTFFVNEEIILDLEEFEIEDGGKIDAESIAIETFSDIDENEKLNDQK